MWDLPYDQWSRGWGVRWLEHALKVMRYDETLHSPIRTLPTVLPLPATAFRMNQGSDRMIVDSLPEVWEPRTLFPVIPPLEVLSHGGPVQIWWKRWLSSSPSPSHLSTFGNRTFFHPTSSPESSALCPHPLRRPQRAKQSRNGKHS